jgi:hypothetical protein
MLGEHPRADIEREHRHAELGKTFAQMRREAVVAMQSAGAETRGRVADIFAAPRPKGVPTRSVVVALASTPGLVASLRWLAGEGVRVESIVTPALALMSLARLRRTLSAPNRIEAYVALEATTTAVALVRNGLLMAACELDWGYEDENGFPWHARRSRRLAEEIDRFLAGRRGRGALAQVCICGGLPELRSMAVGLMEALDVEVETLDSLFGIDTARLPEPAGEFREHAPNTGWRWPPRLTLARSRQPAPRAQSAPHEGNPGACGRGRRRDHGSGRRLAAATQRLVAILVIERAVRVTSRRRRGRFERCRRSRSFLPSLRRWLGSSERFRRPRQSSNLARRRRRSLSRRHHRRPLRS